ncbi:unnamed protein product [Clonostachys rosea f. rosea IK726]|uniref:AMP-dependent synthetase/ligase domain-containing protein n=2 Tax=Bionectria ochroleuca TaxID=29856 RepID=A0A0B7JN34_BIOOC|nr:unnamed protein product [Clonostachys rosea f. rosea IK726]
MPIQSRWSVPIPEQSLQKWVFGSSFGPLPDRVTFIDADNPDTRSLTFSEYRLLSKRVALGLQKAGLAHGDRVLLFSGNTLFFPAVFMGVLMAGGIFTGASPAFGSMEFSHQLINSGARFVIAGKKNVPVALDAMERNGLTKANLYTFDDALSSAGGIGQLGIKHWSALLANPEEAERFDWVEPSDPRTSTCCLNYSSGTTGLAKGVEISHYAYIANGVACHFLEQQTPESRELLKTSKSLCFLPLYHAAGQTTFVANQPKLGVTTYIMPEYNFEKLLQHIQRFKITSLSAAPPIILNIAKSPLCAKYDLSSVRDVTCGTAPLSREVADETEQKLWPHGENFVRQGWGMTEITCAGLLWSTEDMQKSISVGEAVPNGQFKIMEGEREVTEPNKVGEIWYSGPTLMKGYWRNPKATAETVVEEGGVRWIKTGDLAYVDRYAPGAKVFIVDRVKELIKVRGFQVSPAELEGVLLDRKDIVDVGVVGVLVNGEEVPRAYVVKGADVSEREIMKWLEGRVAKYKWLRGGVVFVDSIPKTLSGKILRRSLREMAKASDVKIKAKLS